MDNKEVKKFSVSGKEYKVSFNFESIQRLYEEDLWSFSKERQIIMISKRAILAKIYTDSIQSKQKEIHKLQTMNISDDRTKKIEKLSLEMQKELESNLELLSETEQNQFYEFAIDNTSNIKERVSDGQRILIHGLYTYQPELTRDEIAEIINNFITEYGYVSLVDLCDELIEMVNDFFIVKQENDSKKKILS